MNVKETKKNIIQAGHRAVEELIKVAKEAIVDSDDDISADRLKNAAATKKLAIFDAFEILNRIKEEEDMLNEKPKEEKKNQAFGDRCFINPIHNNDDLDANLEERLIGILKYGNSSLEALEIHEGDLVGLHTVW